MLETVYDADLGGDAGARLSFRPLTLVSSFRQFSKDRSALSPQKRTRRATIRPATRKTVTAPTARPRGRSERPPNTVAFSEDDEEEERGAAAVEAEFDFVEFVRRFCRPGVVRPCAALLRRAGNAPRAAHCALRLLHRVARECGQAPLLFQASLLATLRRALAPAAPAPAPPPELRLELARFAAYVLREFAAAAEREPKLFVELLFWKTPRDALAIRHGYDAYSDRRLVRFSASPLLGRSELLYGTYPNVRLRQIDKINLPYF